MSKVPYYLFFNGTQLHINTVATTTTTTTLMENLLDDFNCIPGLEEEEEEFEDEDNTRKKKRKKKSSEFSTEEGDDSDDDDDEEDEDDDDKRPKTEIDIFFDDVNKIREHLNVIRKSIRSLRDIATSVAIEAASEAESAKKSKMLNTLISVINKRSDEVRSMLKRMKTLNTEYATSERAEPSVIRVRTNMHSTLCKSFTELMRSYNDAQTEYQSNAKERLARQCRVVKPDLTDEEIDSIIETGDAQVFKEGILEKDLREKATQALAYVENKHNDIVRLTESIKELHGMFVDLAALVDNQADLIDDIETNCRSAVEYTEKAIENLHAAAVLQKKARSKMCFIVCMLVCVLIGVMIFIFVYEFIDEAIG